MMLNGQMYWFIGVVENRSDPEKMGRVKVRVYGIHTDDKTVLPTEDLPWSQVMMPITSGSLAGIGTSATGILNGSWVVGYFIDGSDMQESIIIGTLPSKPYSKNPEKGFNDPKGRNPIRSDGIDTPDPATALAFDKHPSYSSKVDLRQTKVETAIPPFLKTVSIDEEDDPKFTRNTWDVPEVQRGNSPSYPFNKVEVTESGHVFEVDDTPGNERISTFHTTGTNWEIQDNGDKTMAIRGDNYTVIFGNDKIYVKGNVDVTIDGDKRELIKGNYHLEVEKDYTMNIKGSRNSAVGNNELLEVGQEYSANINEDYSTRIGGHEIRIVDKSRNTTIGDSEDLTVTTNMNEIVSGKRDMFTKLGHTHIVTDKLNISALDDITIGTKANHIETIKGNRTETITGDVSETIGGNVTEAITGNLDIDAARIDLN